MSDVEKSKINTVCEYFKDSFSMSEVSYKPDKKYKGIRFNVFANHALYTAVVSYDVFEKSEKIISSMLKVNKVANLLHEDKIVKISTTDIKRIPRQDLSGGL